MGNCSVIIVDDDKSIASLLEDILILKGFEVAGIAYDGDEAISLYKKLSPEIVLLDVSMPKKDGYETLSELKSIDPKSKVIMVTGEGSLESHKRLEDLGALAIVTKPFDIDKLAEVITNAQSLEKSLKNLN